MSDFWSNVLGSAPPAPEPTTPGADVPWWQRVAVNVPATRQQQPEQVQPQQPGEDAPKYVDPESSRARTQWSRETSGNCPGCGSENYSGHPEYPSARPRCFDCGYPLTQSGSGSAPQGDAAGPVAEARQIRDARTSNYNPRMITQHVHPQQRG